MRITGGVFRSRTLVAPRGAATRPTSDRVREALFSVLGSRDVVNEARVLDLYAGTGALAIEALSRGAAHATFVEHARAAVTALRANLRALDLGEKARVVVARAERAAELLAGETFDLVFADPPYSDVAAAVQVLEALTLIGSAKPGATIVLEHAAKESPPTIYGLERVDLRRYGDTSLSFFVAPR